jgi:GntR family transcriptional regulator/MocR family aminotransferase
MQPFISLLSVDKQSRQPVYLQIAGQLAGLIRNGDLPAGHRLQSTRLMASLLRVHRLTVVRAYEELLAQGWLESRTGSGTFVASRLPGIKPQLLPGAGEMVSNPLEKAGFSFQAFPHLDRNTGVSKLKYHLDEGIPDPRLAPLEELSRAYRAGMLTGNRYLRLGYGDPKGSSWLRQELSRYLNETRGMKTGLGNILVTRGVVMGIYLVSAGLLAPGDRVIAGEPGWEGANANFQQAGARLIKIPVDDSGLDTNALEKVCRRQKIRLVYTTPHHHYPTTVALRAERRLHLLQLAEKYGFIIFEDDYDYDFHYLSRPLLPLAASDHAGMVMYCGSFSKTVAPAFRVGYLAGPGNVIHHLSRLRRIIDRQGDNLLENAVAELLREGVIQRHLRKSLRTYKARRDIFCELLKEKLDGRVEFQVPDGGMAVWARFNKSIDLIRLSAEAKQRELYIPGPGQRLPPGVIPHAIRLGFASSTPEELECCVTILSDLCS